MANIVYRSPRAPEAFFEIVNQDDTGLDMTTVTAATYSVKDPLGIHYTWDCILINQSTANVTVVHPFVSGDLDITGDYEIFANLTIPGGVVRTVPKQFTVVEEYTPG